MEGSKEYGREETSNGRVVKDCPSVLGELKFSQFYRAIDGKHIWPICPLLEIPDPALRNVFVEVSNAYQI